MYRKQAKILMLVEGAKTDVKLMKHLLKVYGISDRHEIVSYRTNIYTLYQEMFYEKDPDAMDLQQVLIAREPDESKKKILAENYSDILLIFDLDPQDGGFSPDKILEMQNYFVESSDMGKLYLNYPMVEAFYHLKDIPDDEYYDRQATMEELIHHTYKSRVNSENRNHDYGKFALTKEECSIVIQQNLDKGRKLIGDLESTIPDLLDILNYQLKYLDVNDAVYVLCTCAYYIADYNPYLLF